MSIKTIVWDIDGVLIWHHPTDPSKDWRKDLMHTDVLGLWESFQKSRDWEFCLRDKDINTRQRFEHFLSEKNITVHEDPNHIIDIWLQENVIPNKPALDKLQDLQGQGFQCVLGTNQDGLRKPYIENWLNEQGLGDLELFMSCDMNCAKPDAFFYKSIEESLGRTSSEILLLDDTYNNIEGAKDARWNALHISDHYKTTPDIWSDLHIKTE